MEALINEGLSRLPSDLSAYFRDADYWKDHKSQPPTSKAPLVWEEYTYQLREFGVENGYRWTSFLFQGFTENEFKLFSQKTWKEVSSFKSESAVFPVPEMLDLIQFLIQKNWEVYIVTASPELGIAAVAEHFMIPDSHVIGMRQEISKDGKTLPKIIEPYTYGEGKVKAIQNRIGYLPDIAFGDSFNDFPMLCSAKQQGVAIDKGNLEFVAACEKEGIRIQPFFPLS